MYAKIINEETKLCQIGTGTNTKYYQSIGMTEMEVEEAYNGNWYVKGYAPEKPDEVLKQEVRSIRNNLLKETDLFMLIDYPIEDEEKELYKEYRKYLRDYTTEEDWWKETPLDFENWKG